MSRVQTVNFSNITCLPIQFWSPIMENIQGNLRKRHLMQCFLKRKSRLKSSSQMGGSTLDHRSITIQEPPRPPPPAQAHRGRHAHASPVSSTHLHDSSTTLCRHIGQLLLIRLRVGYLLLHRQVSVAVRPANQGVDCWSEKLKTKKRVQSGECGPDKCPI